MPERHAIAVNSLATNDLFMLAEMLKHACQDSINSEVSPFKDTACRVICHQIAFAGNGDLPFKKYYQDAYDYCVEQVERDKQDLPETPNVTAEPTYKTS